MSEQLLYLPKVLFQKRPEAVASIAGNRGDGDIRGECLIYPFQAGSIIISAVNGLPDGFFRLRLSSDFRPQLELPSLLSSRGFSYCLVYDGRFRPTDITPGSISVCSADNDVIASATVERRVQGDNDSGDIKK